MAISQGSGFDIREVGDLDRFVLGCCGGASADLKVRAIDPPAIEGFVAHGCTSMLNADGDVRDREAGAGLAEDTGGPTGVAVLRVGALVDAGTVAVGQRSNALAGTVLAGLAVRAHGAASAAVCVVFLGVNTRAAAVGLTAGTFAGAALAGLAAEALVVAGTTVLVVALGVDTSAVAVGFV